MLVIVGLIVLLVAAIATIVGERAMRGRPTHRPKLCVPGYHLSGSTGTVFLFGIMVGAVAPLLTGSRAPRHHARRSASTRRSQPSPRHPAPTPTTSRHHDHRRRRIKPQRAAAEVHYKVRWSPGRQPMTTGLTSGSRGL